MKIDIKYFAKELDGVQYGEISNHYIEVAKNNGFVIVSGASDDLVEFEGVYREEAGCFDGCTITFDSNGTSDDGNEHRNRLDVFWCGKCGNYKKDKYEATWEYETDIPHETFKMYEDDYLYCIGLVFKVDDMK